MADIKRIGMITSGGDCGGLNAVIKGASLMCHKQNIECFVIPNGYAGLYNLMNFESLTELTPGRTDLININLAGSEAGHSRVKISKIKNPKKYDRIKKGLDKFDIDALLISGGDDTGSVIVDLNKNGIPAIHVPKTMDLDLQTYSVGADSTMNRIAQFTEELKTTSTTHNRIIVLEIFGRNAGHTALRGGIAADADAILIPEIPVDFDILYEHVKKVYKQRLSNSDVIEGNYLIVVAEGLTDASGKEIVDESAELDAFGHKKLAGAGKYVSQELNKRFKEDNQIADFMKKVHLYVEGIYTAPEVRNVRPGHLVRCGHTSVYDANFGKECGAAGVILLKKGLTGITVVDIKGEDISYMKTEEAIKQRTVDLKTVSLHENMGTCFGRKPEKYSGRTNESSSQPLRFL